MDIRANIWYIATLPTWLGLLRDILLMISIVLTMVAALWGQLEHRAKQIMPWCLMSRREAPAQNSLMLNYVTSSTPGSLVRSLKRKHLLVSVGICGSLIIRLMIVFAAGLLRLEYKTLSLGTRLSGKDIFDITRSYSSPSHSDDHDYWTNTDYWTRLKYGLHFPHGTTSQFAVQSFVNDDDSKSGFKEFSLFNYNRGLKLFQEYMIC